MAFEIPALKFSRPAGADLSAASNQYKLVKFDSSGNIVLCSAVTDVPCGILQNKPASGVTAEVLYAGVSKVHAGASIAIGDLIGPDTSGRAVKQTPGTDTTHYAIGQVMLAAGAAAVIGTALINAAAPHRAA